MAEKTIPHAVEAKKVNKWLIAATVMLGTIMEILDSTIVNVALPHMQGSLSASVEEVSWIVTSYLVSNAIIMPITGWLSGLFGRKNFLIFCIILFTFSSFGCGAAPNLEILIVFRILQGMGGAALIPISQAVLMETFPPKEQGMAMAVWGIGIMSAPIMGPTIGGWITDNYNWRWIFYINLPVGALTIFMASLFISDPHYLKRQFVKIDFVGLILLIIGLGAFQIVLDRGQLEDWFDSSFIIGLTVVSSLALLSFLIVEKTVKHPVIDLSIFKNRTYSAGIFIMTIFGFGLYGSMILMPLYLQHLLGYSALLAGLAVGPGGLGSLITMPIAGRLINLVEPRYIIMIGVLLVSSSLFLMSGFNLNMGYWDVVWPRFLQGMGLGFCFVPLSTTTLSVIPREKMGNASGVYNLMRNIGASIGIALATTILSRRTQFHHDSLINKITPFNPEFQITQGAISSYLAGGSAVGFSQLPVLGLIYGQLQRQAAAKAFLDDFWMIGVLFLVVLPLLVLLKKGSSQPAGGGH